MILYSKVITYSKDSDSLDNSKFGKRQIFFLAEAKYKYCKWFKLETGSTVISLNVLETIPLPSKKKKKKRK